MNYQLYKEFFRALGNQGRFAIVQMLRTKPHFVGELAEKLGLEQSRVSHNLACLLNCGFVFWEWNGKNKVYRLHPGLNRILSDMDRHLEGYAGALGACGVLKAETAPVIVVRQPVRTPTRTFRASKSRKTIGAKK